jgi:DNA-binding NarL/FixJ family response regulator
MGETVRVLVVDDDPVVRDAYRAFLGGRPGLELCGEAGDGQEGLEAYGRLRPDVVLMDLQMPRMSGIEAIAAIAARWPDACVVALTTFGTTDYITAALRAGAAGYLVKDVDGDALAQGISQAVAGDMPLSPAVRRELVASVLVDPAPPAPVQVDPGLTPRERELLGWLAAGLTNQQIGAGMYLSEGSVKQYLSHVGEKLGAKTRTQILVRSIQLGLVDLSTLPSSEG